MRNFLLAEVMVLPALPDGRQRSLRPRKHSEPPLVMGRSADCLLIARPCAVAEQKEAARKPHEQKKPLGGLVCRAVHGVPPRLPAA